MSRKVLLLNFALAGLLIWLGVRLSEDWQKASAKRTEVMSRKPQPQEVKAPAAVPAVEAPPATQYLEVATKMLFSKDRNPVEIIPPPPPKPDPPPPPPPPEPTPPPMPIYYGQMNFADPVLFLSVDGKQRSYHKGDKVGEFDLTEFDEESLTLTWKTKTFHKMFAEIKAKEPPKVAQVAAAPAASTGGGVTKIGSSPSTANAEKPKSTAPQFGEKQGTYYMCAAGDTSPDGTVLDGYRLKRMDNLFGSTCQWEPTGR
jgi:hypothetical protein